MLSCTIFMNAWKLPFFTGYLNSIYTSITVLVYLTPSPQYVCIQLLCTSLKQIGVGFILKYWWRTKKTCSLVFIIATHTWSEYVDVVGCFLRREREWVGGGGYIYSHCAWAAFTTNTLHQLNNNSHLTTPANNRHEVLVKSEIAFYWAASQLT